MQNTQKTSKFKFLLAISAALISIGGTVLLVERGSAKADAAEAPAAPPAVPVVVQTVKAQSVQTWSSYSGRLQAVDFAEIRPQVNGRITEVRFQDGQLVKKGQIIYVIEPISYEANMTRAEANAKLAKLELDRAAQLVKTKAIAKAIYDQRQTAKKVAEAELKQARLDLDRAYVKAPISGRIGRAEITVGNVVEAGSSAPLLTSIVANDSIYVDFEVDEKTYMQVMRDKTTNNAKQTIPVEVSATNDKQTYRGALYAFDNRIDTTTGTIRARAKFANQDGALIPGMFVNVRMSSGQQDQALLVPERAISVDQDKKFVYVVDKNNTIEYRLITSGESAEGKRIITSGLASGDRVVVDGVQHIRPGAAVTVQELKTETAQNNSRQS